MTINKEDTITEEYSPWIPVTKELPSKEDIYFVILKLMGRYYPTVSIYTKIYDYTEEKYTDTPVWTDNSSEWGTIILDNVVAWMPTRISEFKGE